MTEKTIKLTGISALILLLSAIFLLEIQAISNFFKFPQIFKFPQKTNLIITYAKAFSSLVLLFLGIYGIIVKLKENKRIKHCSSFMLLGVIFSSLSILPPISTIYFLNKINIDKFNFEEKIYFQELINQQIQFLIVVGIVFVLLTLCLSMACKKHFNKKAT